MNRHSTTTGWQRIVVALLLVALISLFAYNVVQWFFLCDDCFISFRYSRNLVDGHGLVWNPGERVEGYTNFLWVMFMAAGIAVGVAPEVLSTVIGIVSGAALLAVLLVFSAVRWGWNNPFIWLAPFALAASRSYTAWSSGGLETMFFTTILFLACLVFLRERHSDARYPLGSSLLLATATLTRPDGGLFALVLGLFFLGEIVVRRRKLIRGVIWVAPYAVLVGTHLLWRHAYYGSWLPNSFHAKVPGAWWEQGWRYLCLFAEDYRILWFVPLAIVAVLPGRRFVHGMFAALICAWLLYVLYIGGDRFEFRFLVVVFPYFYWLVSAGMRSITLPGTIGTNRRLAFRLLTLVLAAALVMTTHFGSWRAGAGKIREGIAGIQHIRNYAAGRAEQGKFLRRLIDTGQLPSGILLCVGGAGALPYYSGWPTLDRRGINDSTVARTPITERGIIGHEREATYEYLLERGVVVLDMYNRLVFERNIISERQPFISHGSNRIPLRAYRVEDRYLIFGTLVSDIELERHFGHLERVY